MKVIVISEFYDLKEDKLRKVGETFEVSNARFDEIVKKGGEWVEELATEPEGEEAAKNPTVEEMETVEEANAKETKEVEEAAEEKPEIEDAKVEEVDNKAKKNTTPKKAGAKSDGGRTKKA